MEVLVIILIIISWLSFAFIASIIGDAKGGDALGWFFYGLVLPLVAIAHALAKHRTLEEEQRRHVLAGRIACRLCAEYISPKAVVCPFCQRNIDQNEISAEQPASANGDDKIILFLAIGGTIAIFVIIGFIITASN